MKKLLILIAIFLCFLPGSPQESQPVPVESIHSATVAQDPISKLDQLYHRVDSAKKVLHEKGN